MTYVYNKLTVTGIVDNLYAFHRTFFGTHMVHFGIKEVGFPNEKLIDFFKLGPEITEYRFHWKLGEKPFTVYYRGSDFVTKFSFANFFPLPKEAYMDGATDWCLKHWGTPKDLSITSVCNTIDLYRAYENGEDGEMFMRYEFVTMMFPPMPVIKKMAKDFPALRFHHQFRGHDERSKDFKGEAYYEEGEMCSLTVTGEEEHYKRAMNFYERQKTEICL